MLTPAARPVVRQHSIDVQNARICAAIWCGPQAIHRTALLTIEGELGRHFRERPTEAAHGLCTGIPAGKREHLLVPRVGRYGIFSGRRWREAIGPRIRDFIRKHS
jgi:poly(3-hydroxybutyrate) depolymerase